MKLAATAMPFDFGSPAAAGLAATDGQAPATPRFALLLEGARAVPALPGQALAPLRVQLPEAISLDTLTQASTQPAVAEAFAAVPADAVTGSSGTTLPDILVAADALAPAQAGASPIAGVPPELASLLAGTAAAVPSAAAVPRRAAPTSGADTATAPLPLAETGDLPSGEVATATPNAIRPLASGPAETGDRESARPEAPRAAIRESQPAVAHPAAPLAMTAPAGAAPVAAVLAEAAPLATVPAKAAPVAAVPAETAPAKDAPAVAALPEVSGPETGMPRSGAPATIRENLPSVAQSTATAASTGASATAVAPSPEPGQAKLPARTGASAITVAPPTERGQAKLPARTGKTPDPAAPEGSIEPLAAQAQPDSELVGSVPSAGALEPRASDASTAAPGVKVTPRRGASAAEADASMLAPTSPDTIAAAPAIVPPAPLPAPPAAMAAPRGNAQDGAAVPPVVAQASKARTGAPDTPVTAIAASQDAPAEPNAAKMIGNAATDSGESGTGEGLPRDAGEFAARVDAASPDAAPRGTQPLAAPRPDVAQRPATPAPATAPAAAPQPAPQQQELAAKPGQIGRDLGIAIARSVGKGDDALRIRLNPAEFGRIDVTLAFEEGTLRATMRADSPAALDLLRRESADLGRALDQAGVRADAQSFRFEGQSQQQNAGGQGAGREAAQRWAQQSRSTYGDSAANEPAANAWQPMRTAGRVDLIA